VFGDPDLGSDNFMKDGVNVRSYASDNIHFFFWSSQAPEVYEVDGQLLSFIPYKFANSQRFFENCDGADPNNSPGTDCNSPLSTKNWMLPFPLYWHEYHLLDLLPPDDRQVEVPYDPSTRVEYLSDSISQDAPNTVSTYGVTYGKTGMFDFEPNLGAIWRVFGMANLGWRIKGGLILQPDVVDAVIPVWTLFQGLEAPSSILSGLISIQQAPTKISGLAAFSACMGLCYLIPGFASMCAFTLDKVLK
jgi:hypothetical protein